MMGVLSHIARSILAALLFVSLAVGCSDAAGGRPRAENKSSGELRVSLGQTVMLQRERLRIKFAALVNESRCATGITCVWAGDAEIAVEVSRVNAASAVLQLHTNPRFAQRGQYQDHEIALVGLAPYPRSGAEIEPDDYVATLTVKRQ
jgi:hypothetical protein